MFVTSLPSPLLACHPAPPDYQANDASRVRDPRRGRPLFAGAIDIGAYKTQNPMYPRSWVHATLWVPNMRPRCLTCGFESESGRRRCRCQPRAACSAGERQTRLLNQRGAQQHAGGRSVSWVDNRSVPEVMGFREAEVAPAYPRLLSVVQWARLVVVSRGGRVPC